jgi:hypothetical protein
MRDIEALTLFVKIPKLASVKPCLDVRMFKLASVKLCLEVRVPKLVSVTPYLLVRVPKLVSVKFCLDINVPMEALNTLLKYDNLPIEALDANAIPTETLEANKSNPMTAPKLTSNDPRFHTKSLLREALDMYVAFTLDIAALVDALVAYKLKLVSTLPSFIHIALVELFTSVVFAYDSNAEFTDELVAKEASM